MHQPLKISPDTVDGLSKPLEAFDRTVSAPLSKTVTVVGLGYIGLPTAAVLAQAGMRVFGVDIAPRIVDTINEGRVHIEEKNLESLVRSAVTSGMLSADTVVRESGTYIVAVPTPLMEDGRPNIEYVLDALDLIAPHVTSGSTIILESTSPVGTTRSIAQRLARLRPDLNIPTRCNGNDGGDPDIAIAYCPERVLPGNIIEELIANDRVIGGLTPACAERAARFYRRFVSGTCLATEAGAAEMVKLAENSFRDVNIAFANELSLIAEEMGIDVWEVIRLANRHPRVQILQPGPGVGGHCIAVDPWFLVAGAPDKARIIRTAREVNDGKAIHVAARLRAMLDAAPDAKLALLGLAFKPNIDDFRESPALQIAEELADFGDRLLVVEPFADTLPGKLEACGARLLNFEEAMAQAELVGVLVDHDAFKNASPDLRRGKLVYDTRGMWIA